MQVSNLVFYAQSSGSKTGLVWAEGHSYVTLTDPLGGRGDSYVTLTDVGFLPIHVEIWMSLGVSHQAG